MSVINWSKEMWRVTPEGNVACEGGWVVIQTCTTVKDAKPRAQFVATAPKMYHALEKAEKGYHVFKTLLAKAGLTEGYDVACEHLREIEAVLKEARGEK